MFVSAFKVSIYSTFSLPGACNISLTRNKKKRAAKEIIKQKAKETKEKEAEREREREREREGGREEESKETILHYLQLLAPSHLSFNEPTCQGRGGRRGT